MTDNSSAGGSHSLVGYPVEIVPMQCELSIGKTQGGMGI